MREQRKKQEDFFWSWETEKKVYSVSFDEKWKWRDSSTSSYHLSRPFFFTFFSSLVNGDDVDWTGRPQKKLKVDENSPMWTLPSQAFSYEIIIWFLIVVTKIYLWYNLQPSFALGSERSKKTMGIGNVKFILEIFLSPNTRGYITSLIFGTHAGTSSGIQFITGHLKLEWKILEKSFLTKRMHDMQDKQNYLNL